MIKEVKASLVRDILPNSLLVITAVISIFVVFVDICTILFFGVGEHFTNVKELFIFLISAVISVRLGLGKRVLASIKVDKTKGLFVINLISKNINKEYNLSPSDIKCIHQLQSKDVTLCFNNKRGNKVDKLRLVISGKDIGNPSELINTLKEYNVAIKTHDDEARTS